MVASFYLPVTLTKRTVPGCAGDADPDADDADCGGWTAEWDHEQLIALQVTRETRDDTWDCCCCPVMLMLSSVHFCC